MATPVIKETTNYSQFNFIKNNREQSRGHIESLKKAFEEYGNLTQVQPILVNEKMEIIDGQHRFTAAQELGQPVFYTVAPGLRVTEARAMNILHRGWTTDDYARSYAISGNQNYQKYVELKEDFGFGHAIMLVYSYGGNSTGMYKRFREGDFILDDIEQIKVRLVQLEEVGEYTSLGKNRPFALAYLAIMKSPEYDHKHFMRKLQIHGDLILKRYGSAEDNLRQLEELYNYKSTAANRARLY